MIRCFLRTFWFRSVGIWGSDTFRAYLIRRRYHSMGDGAYLRRAFLECWAEPGFHRFWRVWNPALGYLVFRLYRRLGGMRRDPAAKVLAFLLSGVLHNLFVSPWLGWSYTLPVAFGACGILVALWPAIARRLQQHRWPWPANVVVNATLVATCFDSGFRIERWLG